MRRPSESASGARARAASDESVAASSARARKIAAEREGRAMTAVAASAGWPRSEITALATRLRPALWKRSAGTGPESGPTTVSSAASPKSRPEAAN